MLQGGTHLGSVYLQHKIGIKAAANIALLEHIAACLRTIKGPWLIGGDFNGTPQQLEDTGFLELVDGVIHAPSDHTCNGK